MHTVCVANQKGGCGKTTTAVNLAAALAARSRVLLIDLDPQAHATLALGVSETTLTTYDLLCRRAGVADVRLSVSERLDLVPSQLFLAAAEAELAGRQGAEGRLRAALELVRDDYDYALIDCPPNLGILTFNGLRASGRAVVPVEPSVFALQGLGKLRETIDLLRRNFGQQIELRALVSNLDPRTRFARRLIDQLSALFGRGLFKARVRSCIKVREAAEAGLPLAAYAPRCTAAADFAALARELVAADRRGMRAATFFLDAPAAERVRLVGDFCGWRLDAAVEMARGGGGRWQAEARLAPGAYHYKYLVDDAWRPDPENRCRIPDPFGGTNSLLVMED